MMLKILNLKPRMTNRISNIEETSVALKAIIAQLKRLIIMKNMMKMELMGTIIIANKTIKIKTKNKNKKRQKFN